jgi:ABC-type transport system involved in multi-copper enzyme maturation permease subunit
MRYVLQSCRALTLQTAVEILRQPLPVLLTILATVLAALFPMVLAFQFGEEGRLVRDGILALHFTLGVYLAAVASSATLGRELESGSGALVLSKAVSHELFYLSKFFGVVLVLAVFTLCMGLAAVLSSRVGLANYVVDSRAGGIIGACILAACVLAGVLNFWKGRPFPSTAQIFLVIALLAAAGLTALEAGSGSVASLAATALHLGPALLLIFLALVMMAAITLALAARLPAVPVVSLGALVFLLGLINGPLFGKAAARGNWLAAGLSALLPDWQHFWLVDALSGSGHIPAAYVGWAALYAAVYTGGILLAGLALFRGREI